MKKIIYSIIFLLINVVVLFSQNKISLDTINTLNKRTSSGRYGLHLFEGGFYYDPIYNKYLKNTLYSSCWSSEFEQHIKATNDTMEYCFFVAAVYREDIFDGLIQYYNSDSLMVMSGTMLKGKPHGRFLIFCSSFPYCKSVDNFPIRELIYIKGKLISDITNDTKTKNTKQIRYKHFGRFKKVSFPTPQNL